MDYKDIFNQYLSDNFYKWISIDNTVTKAMHYSLIECGGKRIRPIILMQINNMFNGEIKASLDLASALECIHTYSLIHDDLPCMDDDTLRRGNPCCHIKFGYSMAVLAGDALNTLAFQIIGNSQYLSDKQKTYATYLLANLAGNNGMVAGQCLDLESENNNIDFNTLKQLHYQKTGCLLAAATTLGCVSANKFTLIDSFKQLGLDIGLAFQIQDDILDYTSDSATLGKTNSDIENNKSTSVSILGLDKAKQLMEDIYQQSINCLNNYENNNEIKETILQLIKRNY